MARKPKIAVIMDENTSTGSERYDVSKHYFSAIGRAGGFAFGIPYAPDMVDDVIDEFDGFVSVGGRINFPAEWYVEGDQSQYPPSDRLAVDMALMKGFLGRNKPVLGICNGMQMLACTVAGWFRMCVRSGPARSIMIGRMCSTMWKWWQAPGWPASSRPTVSA